MKYDFKEEPEVELTFIGKVAMTLLSVSAFAAVIQYIILTTQ